MRQPIPRQRPAAVERNRQQQHLRDQERRLRDRKQLRPSVQAASAGERFDRAFDAADVAGPSTTGKASENYIF
jgi:hypothetical protein